MLPRKYYPLLGLVFLCIAFCFPAVVKADAAPPQAPPGSFIATHDFETHVQMVSEEVLIDIQLYHGPTISLVEGEEVLEEYEGRIESPDTGFSFRLLSEGDLVGRVTASFMMQNQGDEPESFEVWFPIGVNSGYGGVATVANFRAWVDGSLVETGRSRTEDDYGESWLWATWPVDFPVGKQVQLMVAYDLPANTVYQRHLFPYIVSTGAGWWGAIESGTVTYRLPYEITGENVSYYTSDEGTTTIIENVLRWEFSNLEPEGKDNIYLAMMYPSIWEGIQWARDEVEASPYTADAYVRLAHALREAMDFKYTIVSGEEFVPETTQAYETALELAPDDVDIYIDYIEFLDSLVGPNEPIPDRVEPILMQALEVAPDNERLLELERWFRVAEREREQREAHYALQTALPLTQTAAPEETPTPTLTPTLTPTQTPPAPTPTLAATPDVPPQPPQNSRGFPSWVVIIGLAAFLFALVIVFRRQAGYDESGPGL
jgi:hypothetical protein